jgi:histidine kinase
MNFIRSRLAFKLFASYFLVIAIGMGAIWVATRFTVPGAYQRHLSMMEQNPNAGTGMGMGNGQGMGFGPGGMMSRYYQEYQASFNESLIAAVAAASLVAMLASVIISRSIVAPIRSMTNASERIAEGRYDERVELRGSDELSQLATSFNQMAQQLEQVENMRRQLIGDVAHELRTPLTAIKGSAEGLMDGVLPASDETYQQIHNEAERLSRLVDDLQELSRVESRAVPLDIRAVDSASVIGTVVKRLQQQFDAKRVTLAADLPSASISFLADEGRAIQILTNLVGNALQHVPENGAVAISVLRDKNEVKISVRDDGEGIAAEHLSRIFDRFYRVDKSRSRARGGSGVGLTIAKHLVESQGGKIWAESAGKNKGSEFIFTLPAA